MFPELRFTNANRQRVSPTAQNLHPLHTAEVTPGTSSVFIQCLYCLGSPSYPSLYQQMKVHYFLELICKSLISALIPYTTFNMYYCRLSWCFLRRVSLNSFFRCSNSGLSCIVPTISISNEGSTCTFKSALLLTTRMFLVVTHAYCLILLDAALSRCSQRKEQSHRNKWKLWECRSNWQ